MQKIKLFIISKRNFIRQFILYGIIGVTTATLDVVLFNILSDHMSVFISNAISVNIAILLSFLANTFINFKTKDKFFKRLISFFSVGYIGLAIQSGILYIGTIMMDLDKLYVKIFAVFIVAIIQFFVE